MNEQNGRQDATIKDKIRKLAREEIPNSLNPEFAEIFGQMQDLARSSCS